MGINMALTPLVSHCYLDSVIDRTITKKLPSAVP